MSPLSFSHKGLADRHIGSSDRSGSAFAVGWVRSPALANWFSHQIAGIIVVSIWFALCMETAVAGRAPSDISAAGGRLVALAAAYHLHRQTWPRHRHFRLSRLAATSRHSTGSQRPHRCCPQRINLRISTAGKSGSRPQKCSYSGDAGP